MLRNFAVFSIAFSFAFLILAFSIFRNVRIGYAFSQAPTQTSQPKAMEINYNLPYPGSVLPDSILWPLKALRDKIWLALTLNPSKRADLDLLIADKRLGDSQMLFEENKPDLAVSVLTKAEKYLESAIKEEKIAKNSGMNTSDFLNRFAMATLKHRQVMDQMIEVAPEDARPFIVKIEDYPKSFYNEAKTGLLQAGANVPQSPF